MLSWSTYFMCEELTKRGYSLETFDSDSLVRVSKGSNTFFIYTSKNPTVSATTYLLCKDKYLTRQVMSRYNFASPAFRKIHRENIQEVNDLKFPVVAKPINLWGGEGVVVDIKNVEEIERYFEERPQYQEILVEEMLRGDDTRIIIVKGKFFAAVKRIPAFVTGDGLHTISQLVDIENERRTQIKKSDEENNTYTSDLDLIVFDSHSIETISEQGYTSETTPKNSERVFVRKNANTSMGGISVDVTDQVCEAIRTECERLAACLCMTLAGIDIMTNDLSKPLNISEGSGIVEVNSSPGLDLHILTDEGQRRNPVPFIIDEIEEYFAQKNL